MAITFHQDSTVSLGSFIQVLATGHPIGRIFHVNNVYRFSAGAEAQRGEAELEDDDFERLKDKIGVEVSSWRGVMEGVNHPDGEGR